jgi:hypothetical protein
MFPKVDCSHTAFSTLTVIHQFFGQHLTCVGVAVHLPAILEGVVATSSLFIEYVQIKILCLD